MRTELSEGSNTLSKKIMFVKIVFQISTGRLFLCKFIYYLLMNTCNYNIEDNCFLKVHRRLEVNKIIF